MYMIRGALAWESRRMGKNANLHTAKVAKNDEFYTQLSDIEAELRHYKDKEHFRGKVVYCNCDDPSVSNFFHYFSHNFKRLRCVERRSHDPHFAGISS